MRPCTIAAALAATGLMLAGSLVAGCTGTTSGSVPTVSPGPPWGARLVSTGPLISLASDQASLYGTMVGGPLVERIARIDPATGAVLRQVDYPGQTHPVVLADDLVWALWNGPPLRGLDPMTLKTVASIPVLAVGGFTPAPTAAVAAGPDGTLYVDAGFGVRVLSIPPRAAGAVRILMTIRVPGIVSSLAVSPDGRRLYAGLSNGRLGEYDGRTGAFLATLGPANVISGDNLVASSGGVWGSGAHGAFFVPASSPSHGVLLGVGGAAGSPAEVTVAHGAVWVTAAGRIACADPATGQIRAQTAVPADHGAAVAIIDVVYVGPRAFAIFSDAHTGVLGLATIRPPASCG